MRGVQHENIEQIIEQVSDIRGAMTLSNSYKNSNLYYRSIESAQNLPIIVESELAKQ